MNREVLTCRRCGFFVVAVRKRGSLVPDVAACPECDGVEFTDVHTDAVVRSDGE